MSRFSGIILAVFVSAVLISAQSTRRGTLLGWPNSRADIVGDPSLSNRSINQWFNPAAFAVPAQFTYGNSARNMLFGPGYFNWDAGVFKNTQLTERVNLEFRTEFFNILNHANFGVPASNISAPSTVGRITSTSNSPRDISSVFDCSSEARA